jgi:lactoylglutathione lyase
MRYLHTMVRVTDIDQSLDFYCGKLGMVEVRRSTNEAGRYTLVFLAAPEDEYSGHLAFEVDNIYETCRTLQQGGVTINRPPRDGRMAFVRSPDNISIEILQRGEALPREEPWASMENSGRW